jgi:UDP-N-acetylmuramyl pentapeptide phosphotransferase/UDP-N-acetylglucosamine-1-phosphate transferase
MPGLGLDALAPGMAAAALAVAFLTFAWIGLMTRLQAATDEPKHRGLHAVRTPRAAGLPLYLGWVLALVFAFGFFGPAMPRPLTWVLAVSGLFMALGLLDDFRPLPALPKLLLQLAFAGLALGRAWPGVPALAPAEAMLAALAMIAFVNYWNFMDGSNGMVGWQSLLVAIAVALWPGQAPWVRAAGLALAAACVGFLPFNFPRARVFLGDAGSLALGAALFLLLLLSWRRGVMAWWQVLLLCTPMLLDPTLTLARRVWRGRKFWRAHREHLFQYAVRVGYSHAEVAIVYVVATAVCWLLALAPMGMHADTVGIGLLALAWAAAAFAYLGLRRRWLGRTMRRGGRR